MSDLHEQRARGAKARIELGATEEAFAKVRAASLEAIVKTHPSEVRKLDRLITTVQILDAVKQALLQAAAGESVAEAMLEINPEL